MATWTTTTASLPWAPGSWTQTARKWGLCSPLSSSSCRSPPPPRPSSQEPWLKGELSAGRSSTSLNCSRNGHQILGDHFCMIRPQLSQGVTQKVHFAHLGSSEYKHLILTSDHYKKKQISSNELMDRKSTLGGYTGWPEKLNTPFI